MNVKQSVKKIPVAVASLLKVIIKEAKPDEIVIGKDGSVTVKYRNTF